MAILEMRLGTGPRAAEAATTLIEETEETSMVVMVMGGILGVIVPSQAEVMVIKLGAIEEEEEAVAVDTIVEISRMPMITLGAIPLSMEKKSRETPERREGKHKILGVERAVLEASTLELNQKNTPMRSNMERLNAKIRGTVLMLQAKSCSIC
ncbi:hypothetical protein scyTo_0006938 [Scyliorhinus torazame]|uniref:Uncharacterized protein n=1 Tax=Scyliorhinus torazame TaxID=75743 RepID=A0A401NIW2_SCYTO|nr:hypothetical protein [Scyliorhinus torazame]